MNYSKNCYNNVSSYSYELLNLLYRDDSRLKAMNEFHMFHKTSGDDIYKIIRDVIINKKPDSILDVGCGNGNYWLSCMDFLEYYEGELYLCDQSKMLLNEAKKRLNKYSKCKFYQIDFNYNFKFNKNFDVIILSQVLHHIFKPYELIDKLIKVLNINGVIIISTCHSNHMREIYDLISTYLNKNYEDIRGLSHFNEKDIFFIKNNSNHKSLINEVNGIIHVTNINLLMKYVNSLSVFDQLNIRNDIYYYKIMRLIENYAHHIIDTNGEWNITKKVLMLNIYKENKYL